MIIILRPPAIAACMLAALASMPAAAQDLPQGWRLPEASELTAPQRQASPRRYAKTAADLNGDGFTDEAYLLRHESTGREALWVLLSSEEAFRWIRLAESASAAGSAGMGLDILPPGNHAYTCFYGAANCDWKAAGRSRVALRDPGLRYFNFSGDSSFFFWSRSRQVFLRAHVSR